MSAKKNRFCIYCGTRLPFNANLCPICGKKILTRKKIVNISSVALKKIIYHSLLYKGLNFKYGMVMGVLGGKIENLNNCIYEILAFDGKIKNSGEFITYSAKEHDYQKISIFDDNLYQKGMFCTGWYVSIINSISQDGFFNEINWRTHIGYQQHNPKSCAFVVFPELFFNKEYKNFIRCYGIKDVSSDNFSKDNWIEFEIHITDMNFDLLIDEIQKDYQELEECVYDKELKNEDLKKILAKWMIFESEEIKRLRDEIVRFIENKRENEVKINDYITVRLEDSKSNIYVKRRFFNQCKYLLLNIQVNKISSFDEIDSIDEASELLDKSLEGMESNEYIINIIKPKDEFWAHCSNLQVWAENDYNTRLLHSNLAFPLLKRLTEEGDLLAKKVFKEEIAKRIESNYEPVVKFLIEANYLENLSKIELVSLLEMESINPKIKEFIKNSFLLEH